MFQVPEFAPAKISNVNVRSENRGKKDFTPAVDISLVMDRPNSFLDNLDARLLPLLYCRLDDAPADSQGDLDGVETVSDLPNLTSRLFDLPIALHLDLTGYTVTFERGLAGKSNLEFPDCSVNAFKITPKEGGTCEIKFRVQCNSGLDEKLLGKLALLVKHEVSVQLLPPEPLQADIPNPLPVTELDKPLTAEDVFLNSSEQA